MFFSTQQFYPFTPVIIFPGIGSTGPGQTQALNLAMKPKVLLPPSAHQPKQPTASAIVVASQSISSGQSLSFLAPCI